MFSAARQVPAPSSIHLPALDGVRAIAILMVILYHVVTVCHAMNELPGMTWAQNLYIRLAGQGWMGVDLFFVLSGFLITGILLDVRSAPHALRNFYVRRVLRIMPLYVAFLLFSLWLAPVIGTSSLEETAKLTRTQLWYWTYSMNILIALRDWGVSTLPVAHLWSLAVEEQFYLLWPFAVFLLSPLALRRTALGCIVAAEICRAMFIFVGAGEQVNFVLLPTRMDLLAGGAFLACAYRDRALWSRVLRARQGLTLVALMLLLATLLYRHTIDTRAPFEQIVLLPGIVLLAVVIVSSAAEGIAWLSGAPMQFIGKISYGMYVWHVVAIRLMLMTMKIPEHATREAWWLFYATFVAGTVAITVVVALGSWYAIERPFLSLKRLFPST